MTTTYHDAIIIGSGQGGSPLAYELAKAGQRIALIEREHVGGTCINEGCTPTKTMVASARVAYLARRAADYGVHTGDVRVSMEEVRQRKRDIVESFRTSGEQGLKKDGVDLIFGEASFTGPHEIAVQLRDGGSRSMSAELIVIDTGGRPADPPIPGLADVPHLNSTSIMELDQLPAHLVVLGGGYVGLEFAQMFRRFGSAVTVLQAGPRLMGREDGDIADAVHEILREDGIEVYLNAKTERVEQSKDGSIRLTVQTPEGEHIVSGSHLLVAAGRKPNVEALNLSAAGIGLSPRGFIQVNDRLETAVAGVYALGDVAGSPQFTHMSYDDYRIIATNLLHGGNRSTKDRLVPYTMFIDPQLGRVGITEEEAQAKGLNVRVAKLPMSHVARALEMDESRGLVKAVVDAESGQILGVAVLGIEGGEVMAMFEIAMMGKLPFWELCNGIFAHPTLAELMNNLFMTLDSPRTRNLQKSMAAR